MAAELPDLFRFSDGRPVRSPDDWPARRLELLELIQTVEYGRLPPAPPRTEGEVIMRNRAHEYGARQLMFRIRTGPDLALSFVLNLFLPEGPGHTPPFPVALDGDACWPTMTAEIARSIIQRNYALALFNRLEIASDNKDAPRDYGIYAAYPEGDYGALAAWAWAYSRAVDFLSSLDVVRPDQIIAVGASRGGKAALLAGATDARIALTAPNDSGCCGAGCFRFLGPDAETLRDMIDHAGFWLSPHLAQYVGREHELPFDQHFVKALVAPRALLTTEALGDLGANPTGTWLTHLAAREAYRLLGAPDRIGIHFRPGAHAHTLADWLAVLDFADWHFRGIAVSRRFDLCPFRDLPTAFTWSAPAR